jgi:predicted nucleotidyltransferase
MKLIPFNPSIGLSEFSKKTHKISEFLQTQPRIERAWIFGSFARGDHHDLSDIDIVVESDSTLSLMSLFGIQEQLSILLKQKIDIGFMSTLKPEIRSAIEPDLIEIYCRATSSNHHETTKKQVTRKNTPHVEFHI